MNFDNYITLGGIIFSLGGAWFLVHRQGEDIKNIWKVMKEVRDGHASHVADANEHRIKFIQEIARVEKDSVTKDEMQRSFEKFDEKLDKLDEKLDRLIQDKGH